MLIYCQHAQDFAQGFTWDIFMNDAKTQAACLNAIQTVGEAATQTASSFREAHPEIPWQRLIRTRNIITHGYDGIRWEIVWEILTRDMPALQKQLIELLDSLPTDEPRLL